ncbi:porin family protein [Flavilitoribacter nigricans]|uniref:Outer membrane protein beta-barrel domain-containing protein n=1 Tax=Flavilitoribacter nigricans (strain ATCC 23147 / DSM 23189 / NBRC 102662 / NCIMB 1420 / SS-2) TaxID=1122177 RepID=A0A2D0NB96_FLAN2|nr:outer membrane beta-barrel protein [Flavilitoribacter nigricans]PHN05784.1 hypothetical protein CRP01_15030 [Flavilitoribacter nigricans DSM 23189 = NBRC 102662]
MKRYFFFLMCLLFIINRGVTQEPGPFVPGYYITSNQDTIFGFINNRYQPIQANTFFYKPTLDTKDNRKLVPEAITRIYYEPNFHYRSMTVTKSGKEKIVFMRQLVSGYAELYQELGPGQPIYVLTLESGEEVQLERQDSIIEDHVKLDREYLGKMKYLFRDCPSIVQNYRRINYTQEMLARLVHNYNRCAHADENSELYINRQKLRVSIGVQAGISHTMAEGSSGTLAFEGDGSGWNAGLLAEFYFLRQVALRTGLTYFTYAAETMKEFSFGTDYFKHEVSSLEIPVNIKFQFNQRKFTPYLYGGMNIPLTFGVREKFRRFAFGTLSIDRDRDLFKETILFTINGGVGINYRVFDRSLLFINLDYDYKDVGLNTGSFRPQRFTLSAGIFF